MRVGLGVPRHSSGQLPHDLGLEPACLAVRPLQAIEKLLAGNDAYPKVIRAWAAISRGALQPRYVVEEWAGEHGPVRVELSLRGGGRHVLRPRLIDDYYDLGILTQINELLDPDGPHFVVVERFDQTAVVLAVTDPERRLVETERGWRFARAA